MSLRFRIRPPLVLLMIFMIVVPALATIVDLPVAENSVPRPEEPDRFRYER